MFDDGRVLLLTGLSVLVVAKEIVRSGSQSRGGTPDQRKPTDQEIGSAEQGPWKLDFLRSSAGEVVWMKDAKLGIKGGDVVARLVIRNVDTGDTEDIGQIGGSEHSGIVTSRAIIEAARRNQE